MARVNKIFFHPISGGFVMCLLHMLISQWRRKSNISVRTTQRCMTFVIYHLHLINTIKIMIRTVHLNEDANSSASNSGSGRCSCVSALVLVCVSDVERLTALLLWPFTLSITQSSSHRLASFHLLSPAPTPRLVLISEVCVCDGMYVFMNAWVRAKRDERKYKGDKK